MKPEKVIRNGKVAVLISPEFGAGWSTWADEDKQEVLLFHRPFVEAAEAAIGDIEPIVNAVFGDNDYCYTGGWRDIKIEWLPEGQRFRVHEYDGYETLKFFEGERFFTA